MLNRTFLFTVFLLAFLMSAVSARAQEDRPILVFAAASLKNALDGVAADYESATGNEVTVSYAASSALAKQIEHGAPADLFFSADLDWMDYLTEGKLIEPESRTTLLGNELVLIAPSDSAADVTVEAGFPLAEILGEGRLALGATASVPAGRYARAALESLGVWPDVAGRLAETENVRAAARLVSRGEAPLGVVYATDARADPGLRVLGVFPHDSHPPILYPVALTAAAAPEAAAFLRYLASQAARARFEAEGFRVLSPGS